VVHSAPGRVSAGGNVLSAFLVPEIVVRKEGASPALDVDSSQNKSLTLTLGITRVIEQESLEVSIWGSADQTNWGAKPLVAFPQKFYCGVYQLPLNLSAHPEIRFLRAQWKVDRWGRGTPAPLFGIYIVVQETSDSVVTAQSV
jgi:hypothetical protein